MVLVRGSDDINRECLLLADGACSAAARNEPLSLLLLPMTAISAVVASLFYPVLHHQRSRSGRFLWMYLTFLVSLVLYGLYLWWSIPDGTVGLIVLALLA